MGRVRETKPSVDKGGKPRNRTPKHYSRIENQKEKLAAKAGASKFKGLNSTLNEAGVIFDCGRANIHANDFTKMLEILGEFCGSHYENYGSDVKDCIREGSAVVFDPPEVPEADVDENGDELELTYAQEKEYEMEFKQYVIRKTKLRQNLKNLCATVLGQCTDAMKVKLKSLNEWTRIETAHDALALLQALRSITYNFRSEKLPIESLGDAYRKFYLFRQGKHMTVNDYLDKFVDLVEMVAHCNGRLGHDTHYINKVLQRSGNDVTTATNDEIEDAAEIAQQEYLAVQFLIRADKVRFGKLIEDTQNSYLSQKKTPEDSGYPTTITEAHTLLLNWKCDARNLVGVGEDSAAVAFNQEEESESEDEDNTEPEEQGGTFTQKQGGKRNTDKEKEKKNKADIECHMCGEKGHKAWTCPWKSKTKELIKKAKENETESKEDTGAAMVLHAENFFDEFDFAELKEFAFAQEHEGVMCRQCPRFLKKLWILLDSQSTVHVFCNGALLRNIRPARKPLKLHCNAGTVIITQVGDFPGVGEVYYDPEGIANILSMAKIAETFDVEYSSSNGDCFIVTDPESGSTQVFERSSNGLYYLDFGQELLRKSIENKGGEIGEEADDHAAIFINTVDGNKTKYTRRAYLRAVLARKLHNAIGHPSVRDYIAHVERNNIKNCPITREDIDAAENIFGPNLGVLKGKTTRRRSPRVRIPYTPIPPSIMEKYRNVTLAVDIMKINKIPFFVTTAIDIKFCTSEAIQSMKLHQLVASMKKVNRLYRTRGFKIVAVKADKQYEPIRGDLAEMKIGLNTVAEDEHVPEIERHIRVVKERVRCNYNTLPFNYWPARLIIEAVSSATFWLNAVPPLGGISDTLSPRTLILGGHIDYAKHCKLEFGEYVQTHESHDNTMATRTIGAIALRPTGNMQGGQFFLSLATGLKIDRREWTPLPMPKEVIDQIHRMARRQNAQPGLAFTDRNNVPIPDDDDEDEDDPEYNPDEDISDTESETSDDEDDDDSNSDDDGDNDDRAHQIANDDDNDLDNNEVMEPAGVNNIPNPDANNNEDETDDTAGVGETTGVDENTGVHDNTGVSEQPPDYLEMAQARVDMENKYGKRTDRYNLRPRKPRNYNHLHSQVDEETIVRHLFVQQMNAKAGIKAFGQEGINAIMKEMKQLHDREVGQPVAPESMTVEEKKKALNYLMFLQRKRSGKVKGRGCADGRKQRVYKTKEETASPTVMTESLMITATIDAKEERDVATCDIPGAFMQADIDERLHVRLDGKMAELLVRLDKEKYGKYIRHDKKGKAYIYLLLDKALYGTMQAALLFWKDLTATIKEWGFELNPYDPCVANKMIDGKQCTLAWHVDDMKISHKSSKVVTDIINRLKAKYGKIGELSVTRGKKHDYLGMTIDYSIKGKVQFQMFDYIEKMLSDLPLSMQGESATPAASHLFQVNDQGTKLDKEDADFFHTLTAKALFLSKRARPDIQTTVAFLCTRVKAPDRDDYKKLGRLMNYLRGTKDLPLTLEWDGLNIIRWWADAAFAVHKDMKSHTGGIMSMGKGAIYAMSRKQKLNSRSSTDAELIGADDVMPTLLWSINFIRAQGYDVKVAKLYQDNQSAILLEKNGKASSSRRTRHLNIRFFFITDQIKKGNVAVEYCPTGDMMADFYSKPLQGTPFRNFRDMILNIQ